MTPLKEAYKNDFLVGVAMGRGYESNPAIQRLVAHHFNVLTAENCMKPQPIQPVEGQFHFEPADRLLQFGETHGMKIIGHTLVWNHQTPDWFFQAEAGKQASRELVLNRLKTHINALVGRYKGRILGWDVVNEAFADGAEPLFHATSPWVRTVGPDYIEKAFEFAHQADPEAELYYNDYNVETPSKLKKIVELVQQLKAKGIRIDGVGIQGHLGLNFSIAAIENAITQLRDCGVKVMFTEVDITVLPGKPSGADITDKAKWTAEMDPYREGCPTEILEKQATRYAELFRLFRKHRETITRVTFWGVSDADSWLNHWPIQGRVNYPLLFDRELHPKPAFYAVIQAAPKAE